MKVILLAGLILFFNIATCFNVLADDQDKDLKEIAAFSEKIKNGDKVESASNNYVITPEDRQLFSRESQNKNNWNIEVPKNGNMDLANQHAKQILSAAMSPVQNQLNLQTDKSAIVSHRLTLIFVSFSMGNSTIKQLMSDASQNQNIVLVFRGVKNIDEMGKSLKEISELSRSFSPTPRVMLNPTFFNRFNVTQVPTLILYDEQKDNLIAKVVGLSDPYWIENKIKESKDTDFGIKGPTLQIAELDIIEVMKERAMKIDWEKKKENANNNFWKKQEFLHLPRATRSLSRALDPSIQVTDDIVDGSNNIIVKRGTIINPLDQKSFDKTILVFDPLDKKQINFAKLKNSELLKAGKPVILIATQFDTSKNWDSYKSITTEFNAPVYKLTPDVKSRFLLTAVPSIITADKKSFYIEEVNVAEGL